MRKEPNIDELNTRSMIFALISFISSTHGSLSKILSMVLTKLLAWWAAQLFLQRGEIPRFVKLKYLSRSEFITEQIECENKQRADRNGRDNGILNVS